MFLRCGASGYGRKTQAQLAVKLAGLLSCFVRRGFASLCAARAELVVTGRGERSSKLSPTGVP
jgi:hypothetical protein